MDGSTLFGRSACSALVITCSDFRFKSAERAFAERAGLRDDYDLIARPGAVRSLVAPRTPAMRETMQTEIELLWKLHGFTRVLMLNHMSCRAYDDLAEHADERTLHREHLRGAGAWIAEHLDGVTAEPYLVDSASGELRVGTV